MREIFACALMITFASPLFSAEEKGENAKLRDRVESLEKELLDLKLQHIDKSDLEIGGEFTNLYQFYDYTSYSSEILSDSFGHFISDFRLDFDKTDREDIKFYSTFGATYFWNNSFQTSKKINDDPSESIKGPYLFIEKAFMDYFIFDDKLSFSIGRLPTQFGPPLHLSSNRGREGTYPALLYSIPLDGLALTANLGEMLSSEERYIFRVIFSPLYNKNNLLRPDDVGRSLPFDKLETEDGEAIHVNFEASGKSRLLGSYSAILQGFYSEFGRASSIDDIRGLLQSSLPSGSVDQNVYEVGSDDKKLATMKAAIFYFELENAFYSNFDLYASFKKSWFNKRGNLDAVVTEDNMSSSLGGVGTIHDIGGFIYSDDLEGESYFLGSRLHLSDSANWGVEYIRQTYGNSPTTAKSFRHNGFYNLIGFGYHTYFNWSFTKGVNLALGFSYQERESFFNNFNMSSAPSKINNSYAQLRYSF